MTDERNNGTALSRSEEGVQPAVPTQPVVSPFEMEDEEGGNIDLRRLGAAVLRHKWMVLLLLVLGGVAGYVATRYVRPEYVAQATIWIENGGGGAGTVDAAPLRSSQLLESSAWVDLLRSYVVLDPVVVAERLYLDPARPEDRPLLSGLSLRDRFVPGDYAIRVDPGNRSYVLETAEGVRVEQGSFGDPVGAETLGLEWQQAIHVRH